VFLGVVDAVAEGAGQGRVEHLQSRWTPLASLDGGLDEGEVDIARVLLPGKASEEGLDYQLEVAGQR
jgi:hypothetical protein